ncbi:hypothetical protein [Kitasatospora sp. NPDC059571]|uniref:hypothetical protein n=1 Tax=Kitasatospora sp. NPDC059571 TaxID=3346871 RepID=UPI00367D72C2
MDENRRSAAVLVLLGSLVVAVPGLLLLVIGVGFGVGSSPGASFGDWLRAYLLVLGGPLAGLAVAGALVRLVPAVRRLDPTERAALAAFCLFCGTLAQWLLLMAGVGAVPATY